MNKTYSLSEWVRVAIDDGGVNGYGFKEVDSRLERTIDISVRGLKGVGELFQFIENKEGDLDEQIEICRNSMVNIGFLIDELAENINLCLELKEINLKNWRESEQEEGGVR